MYLFNNSNRFVDSQKENELGDNTYPKEETRPFLSKIIQKFDFVSQILTVTIVVLIISIIYNFGLTKGISPGSSKREDNQDIKRLGSAIPPEVKEGGDISSQGGDNLYTRVSNGIVNDSGYQGEVYPVPKDDRNFVKSSQTIGMLESEEGISTSNQGQPDSYGTGKEDGVTGYPWEKAEGENFSAVGQNSKTDAPSYPVSSADPREVELAKRQDDALLNKFEATTLEIIRSFVVSDRKGNKKYPVRIRIPVVYQSRLLRISPENRKLVEEMLPKLRSLEDNLRKAGKESEEILKKWNQIVRESSPYDVLYPDSPSLPENQSTSPLNRPEDSNSLKPGEKVNFSIETQK